MQPSYCPPAPGNHAAKSTLCVVSPDKKTESKFVNVEPKSRLQGINSWALSKLPIRAPEMIPKNSARLHRLGQLIPGLL